MSGKEPFPPVMYNISWSVVIFFKRTSVKLLFMYVTDLTEEQDYLNPSLTLNIPSLGRQRCLPSWGPWRTPWFFCNFSTL